jgi:hypothetical protein
VCDCRLLLLLLLLLLFCHVVKLMVYKMLHLRSYTSLGLLCLSWYCILLVLCSNPPDDNSTCITL